ncbi:Phage tail tape measure protein TP901, core region, partial [Pseudomonas syringae pv. pisi str. 1704B]
NWQPLTEFFAALWDVIKALSTPVFDFLQTLFAWSPLGMVVANWQPLSEYLAGLWETIKAEAQPFTDVLATLFSFSPLGMIIENWQPIKTWFAGLWADIKPFIEPIMSWFGGDTNKTVLQRATEKANQFAEEQRIRNAGPGGGTGAFLAAGAVENVRTNQQLLNQATGGALRPANCSAYPRRWRPAACCCNRAQPVPARDLRASSTFALKTRRRACVPGKCKPTSRVCRYRQTSVIDPSAQEPDHEYMA